MEGGLTHFLSPTHTHLIKDVFACSPQNNGASLGLPTLHKICEVLISNLPHLKETTLSSTLFLPLSLSLSLSLSPHSPVLLPPSQQTNVEVSGEEDFAKLLQLEEDYVHRICNDIISLKPDLVITEKGVSGKSLWDCYF